MRRRALHACLVAAAVTAGLLVPATGAETERLGGWIVYWLESPVPSIWAVRPDGTRNHRILRGGQNAKRPRLSPDRRWVAFDGIPRGKPPLSDFDIQLVRMNGTGRRALTRSSDWDTDAQWSPDGQWISFTRSLPHPTACTDHSVRIMRRDGSDGHRVADGCSARWSPDGTRLVYASTDGRRLLVVERTGGTPKLLLSGPAQAYEEPAGWSPDGKKILYTRSFFGGLFVMNADGSHKRRILAGEASQPDWR